jgi:hypothetical protein
MDKFNRLGSRPPCEYDGDMKRKRRPSPPQRSVDESLDEFRKSLGASQVQYTDGQLRQMLREIDVVADILLELHS